METTSTKAAAASTAKPSSPSKQQQAVKSNMTSSGKTGTAASTEENSNSKQHVLVLVSFNSLEREVTRKQQQALTLLDSNNVNYEMVDGSDPKLKPLRDKLFGLSPSDVNAFPRQYPQFFVIHQNYNDDNDDGDDANLDPTEYGEEEDHEFNEAGWTNMSIEYWGDFEKLQACQDNKTLAQEFKKGSSTVASSVAAVAGVAPLDPAKAAKAAAASTTKTPSATGGLSGTPSAGKVASAVPAGASSSSGNPASGASDAPSVDPSVALASAKWEGSIIKAGQNSSNTKTKPNTKTQATAATKPTISSPTSSSSLKPTKSKPKPPPPPKPQTRKDDEEDHDAASPPINHDTKNCLFNLSVLVVVTCLVLCIPLALIFGPEQERPRLTALLTKHSKENLPADWHDSVKTLLLNATEQDDDADADQQERQQQQEAERQRRLNLTSHDVTYWSNPQSEKEFFQTIYGTTENDNKKKQKQQQQQQQATPKQLWQDPFAWFDGKQQENNMDEEIQNLLAGMAYVFKNDKQSRKDRGDNDNGADNGGDAGLEELLTQFLAPKTQQPSASSKNDAGTAANTDLEQQSFGQMISLLAKSASEVFDQLNQTLGTPIAQAGGGNHPLERFNLLQFLYFLQHEESIKNPVYKRRQHRFHATLPTGAAIQLHDGLYLSQLAYAPSCREIDQRLQQFRSGLWTLRNCTTTSSMHRPAHFVVVRKLNAVGTLLNRIQQTFRRGRGRRQKQNQQQQQQDLAFLAGPTEQALPKKKKQQLEVAIVIRGSKEVFDFLTDGLLVATDYDHGNNDDNDNDNRDGGKAHDGILRSAQWLEELYGDDLKRLWQQSKRAPGSGGSKKNQLKLWLLGHSLGGGTAALATMEFRRQDKKYRNWLDAEALGFGTPSLVSPHISEQYQDSITTVVNDADLVPRTSGVAIAKAWLRVVSYNWTTAALQDYDQLVEALLNDPTVQSLFGRRGSKGRELLEESANSIRSFLQTWFDSNVAPQLATLPSSSSSSRRETTTTTTAAEGGNDNPTSAAALSLLDEKEVELIPPGECIHFYRDGLAYQATYVNCSLFTELEIVNHFVDDHLIAPGYYPALLSFVRHKLQDDSFAFEDDILEIDYA